MNSIIPPARGQIFNGNIRHPDLYLWDAWSFVESNTIHLYCLAVNRILPNGNPLIPADRNDYPFHVRHFSSRDQGRTWKDEGCFQSPRRGMRKQDARNIWSGSIDLLESGKKLVAYTGLYEVDTERTFLQNISLGISNDGYSIDSLGEEPLSCPRRDWHQIRKQGYYLDVIDKLGNRLGEEDGPILTWRDPFIFVDDSGKIHLFWSAKAGPRQGAIAHGILAGDDPGYRLEKLFPPVLLPDSEEFTQVEMPKILFDRQASRYYLIVSTCNRTFEGQTDDEVDKAIRLYTGESLDGPWRASSGQGSVIRELDGLFGLTVLKADFSRQRLLCMAPYTDAVTPELRLTFAAPFLLDLRNYRKRS